jgi:hypothetical protein
MREFLWGALAMASGIAALFFLRYWMLSRDRLYVFFSVAFAVLMLNWTALAAVNPHNESQHGLYVLRLIAFSLIIVGIIDKNGRGSPR